MNLISDEKMARHPKEYAITDFLVYNIREELYVADSLGRIIAIKLSDGEISETHCFFQVPIHSLSFSPNQSYMAIFYASGCCHIVSSQSFMVELNLTDHLYDPFATSKPLGMVKMKEDLRRMKEVKLFDPGF